LPTVTLPLGMSKMNKLPVGITLVGRKYSDKSLFQMVDNFFSGVVNSFIS